MKKPAGSRALRGGSWINNARNARSACRNANDRDNRWNNNGFRLALSLMAGLEGLGMNQGGVRPGGCKAAGKPQGPRGAGRAAAAVLRPERSPGVPFTLNLMCQTHAPC